MARKLTIDDLENCLGKIVEVELPGIGLVDLKSPPFKYTLQSIVFAKKGDDEGATRILLFGTLKASIPDASDKNLHRLIESMPSEVGVKIIKSMNDLMALDEPEDKDGSDDSTDGPVEGG